MRIIINLNRSLLRLLDKPQPLAVADEGKDCIESVNGGLEGNALADVEPEADGIDNEPKQPLLGILASQCPERNDG